MPVKDIITAAQFCGLLGTIILCIVLVVSGILRWIRPKGTRDDRLNTCAWIAFAILSCMVLVRGLINSEQNKAGNAAVDLAPALIEFFKNVVWLMIFAAIIIAVMALLLVIILAVCKGFHTIIRGSAKPKGKKEESGQAAGAGTGADEDGKPGQDTEKGAAAGGDGKSEEKTKKGLNLADVIREPVVILSISWGILALFFLIPFMVGGQPDGDRMGNMADGQPGSGIIENMKDEQSGNSVIDIWCTGLDRIGRAFGEESKNEDTSEEKNEDTSEEKNEDTSEEKNKDKGENAFVTYALVYIAILGISFAVMKILYSLIAHTFEAGPNQSILDEYSSPIGLLSVGVALLWTFKKKGFSKIGRIEMMVELGKSFLTVVIIVTIFILTLEIIRMLIDIRGKLIRQEAKYLFIALAGHATIFMLGVMISICGALNNAIGSTLGEAMDSVEEKLKLKMLEALDRQIDASKNDMGDGSENEDDPEDEDDSDDTAQKAARDGSKGSVPRHDTAAAQKKSWRKRPTAFRAFYQKVTKK